MRDLTVTIGRQNGSGGREVGKVLADRLGVECDDRTVIEKTADRMGIPVEDAERMEERARTGSNLFFGGIPTANPLFVSQSDVIRSLASKGQCVFVGRCADYVLSGRRDVLNVFVTAPVSDRIRRSADRNGISEKDAYARITSKDRSREEYYLRYTGRRWADSSNYHLTVDTGPIGIEGAVDLILTYMDLMQRRCLYEPVTIRGIGHAGRVTRSSRPS